jgi:hypothetical protein
MTDNPDSAQATAAQVGDLEYDLAHETVADLPADTPPPPAEPQDYGSSITGSTPRRPYDGGDYGYDMAHDT